MDRNLLLLAIAVGVVGVGVLWTMSQSRAESRRIQYNAAGVFKERLDNLAELVKNCGLEDRRTDYINIRIIGQARRAMYDAVIAQKQVQRLGSFAVTVPFIAAMASAVSSNLPKELQSICLVAIAILTGSGGLALAMLEFGGGHRRWLRSRSLAQSLISELSAWLGEAAIYDQDYNGSDGLLSLNDSFQLLSSRCELIIRRSESSAIKDLQTESLAFTQSEGKKDAPAQAKEEPEFDGSDY